MLLQHCKVLLNAEIYNELQGLVDIDPKSVAQVRRELDIRVLVNEATMWRQCKKATDKFRKVHNTQMTIYQGAAKKQMIHDQSNISHLFTSFCPAKVVSFNHTDPNNLYIMPAV